MDIHPDIIKYSAHPDITFGDLKNNDLDKYDIDAQKLQQTQQSFQEFDIQAFMMGQAEYHHKFHSILSKPYIVHYIWDISLLDKDILAIVGPRKHSIYSDKVLRQMFEHAKNYDLVTISGMADGVDQLAHALSVKHQIPTIAVLWWGLQHFLKWPNRHIIHSIVQNGWLVLSEYKIDFAPTKYSFPQRNRIIAGLADLVFLPEAGQNSGSLITAEYALHSQKPVYVVPNDIFASTSFWVHQLLLSQKAQIVLDFPVLFDEYFHKISEQIFQKEITNLPTTQNQIIQLLIQKWELSLWAIMQETKLDTDNIMQHLTLLEINNYIYQPFPGQYARC